MVNFAYALPYIPPAPPAPRFARMRLTWTGWDGSFWELTSPNSGRFLMPGVRGLGMPEYVRHFTKSDFVAGSRHRGSSVMDREVVWPLYEYNDESSAEFIRWKRAFWRTLDPDREGTFRVHLPGGEETRSLRLRFASCPDALEHDPVMMGWKKSGITLLADKTYWRGDPIRRMWTQADPRDYYVTAADKVTHSYPDEVIHYLSAGSSLGSATITNAGDVETFPVWTVIGPTTSVTFGVGEDIVRVPFEVPAGKAIRINTDPVDGQALWFGDWDEEHDAVTSPVRRTRELDPLSKFVAIPAGEDRKLAITMTGTGTVMAEVIPRFREGI